MSRVIDDAFGGKGLTTVPFDLAPMDVAVFSGKNFESPALVPVEFARGKEPANRDQGFLRLVD